MAVTKSPSRSQPGAKPASSQLVREALLRSLRREAGEEPKSRQRLQMVADALVDRAIKGEIAAVREVFHRVGLKIPEAPNGGEGSGPVDLEIRWLTKAEKMPGAKPAREGADSSKR